MDRVVDDPSCARSCDEANKEGCDATDDEGAYTLGCDMHPTAGCDDFSWCRTPPSPPSRPAWTGAGTYPNTPPPPSPPDVAPLVFSAVLLLVALLLLMCAVVVGVFHRCGAGSTAGFCLWQWCGCWLWACLRNVDEATEFDETEPVYGKKRVPNLSTLSDSVVSGRPA